MAMALALTILPGGGPGIRGTGGSNAPKNLAHGHAVPLPDHYHNFTLPDHYHSAGGLYTGNHSHGVSVAANTGNANRDAGGGPGVVAARAWPTRHISTTWPLAAAPTWLATWASMATRRTSASHALPTTNTTWSSTASASFPGTAATSTTTWTANPGTEFRPYFSACYGSSR